MCSANALSQSSIQESGNQQNKQPAKSTAKKANQNDGISNTLYVPTPIQPISDTQGQSSDQQINQEHKWYDTFINHPTEWLLSLFNSCLVLYTYRLWNATNGLRESAEDTAQRQLRAYVSCISKELIFLSQTVLRAEVEFRNTGQTPSHNFRYAIDGGIFSPEEIPTFTDPSFVPHSQPIYPNISWTIGHEFREFDADDIKDIIHDRKLVYIWGKAEYIDIFTKELKTIKFRFRNVVKHGIFDKFNGNLIQIKSWSFYPAEDGNEAT